MDGNAIYYALAALFFAQMFGVDRLFDMLRTAVNITGDASCALIMDTIAGGETKEK